MELQSRSRDARGHMPRPLLGVTASCSISHNPSNHHRCCLSPRHGSVYIVCELAFDFLPPLCVSLTLALTSSSTLPPCHGDQAAMNIQWSRQYLFPLWGGAPARGSPETDTHSHSSRRRAFGPCQRRPPSGPFRPERRPPCPFGPGRAPGAQACLRAHLCGVGSHGAAWQEPRCQEPRARCPEQWEPTLIGKTRQDRAWHRSQRRTNFHSPSPFFGQTFAGACSGVPRERAFTKSASNAGWRCSKRSFSS